MVDARAEEPRGARGRGVWSPSVQLFVGRDQFSSGSLQVDAKNL